MLNFNTSNDVLDSKNLRKKVDFENRQGKTICQFETSNIYVKVEDNKVNCKCYYKN